MSTLEKSNFNSKNVWAKTVEILNDKNSQFYTEVERVDSEGKS
jgi:hypothetical protein